MSSSYRKILKINGERIFILVTSMRLHHVLVPVNVDYSFGFCHVYLEIHLCSVSITCHVCLSQGRFVSYFHIYCQSTETES